MKPDFKELETKVIKRGLCTACGTCVGVCPRHCLGMVYQSDGEPLPELQGDCHPCGLCTEVCPGEDVPIPEMERLVFGATRQVDPWDLGVFRGAYETASVDDKVRQVGSSGGVATALLLHALETGLIDCALVAGFDPETPWRTQPVIATTPEEIIAAAQSKYAVVHINSLLGEAVHRGFKKIGLVALPCHTHGLRKMQLANSPKEITSKLALIVGLLCGAEFYFEGTRHVLGEWCGVNELSELKSIEYRGGDWPSNFIATFKDGRQMHIDRHSVMYHVLLANYKRDRCEMCFDWSAELADVAVGDYWRPDKKAGVSMGSSTLIVRTELGQGLFDSACQKNILTASPLEQITVASGPGYELKKHGAAFRLMQRKKYGWPVPDYHMEFDLRPLPRELHLAPQNQEARWESKS